MNIPWNPQAKLLKHLITKKEQKVLLEELAKIIYDHLCQAQLDQKLVKFIESKNFNQGHPSDFKKAGSI